MDKYFIILLSSCLLIVSCAKKSIKEKEFNDFNINVIDSFYVDSAPLHFQDVKNSQLLFYNLISNDIVCVDTKSKEYLQFNMFGEANNEYQRLQDQSIKFVNDSVISVGKRSSINFYSLKGNFKNYYNVLNENRIPISGSRVFGDTILIGQIRANGNSSKREFYNGKNILFKQIIKDDEEILISDVQQETFAKFPEEGSDLSNGNYYYYSPHTFYSSYDQTKGTYSLINKVDQNVFTYDILSGELLSKTYLELENFNPVKLPFDKGFDQSKALIYLFMDSGIYGYYNYDDTLYILYKQGRTEKEVIEFQKTHSGFPNDESPEFKYWLHISKNGNRVGNDRLLTNSIGPVLGVLPNKKLLLGKYATEEDQKLKGNYFYIAEFD